MYYDAMREASRHRWSLAKDDDARDGVAGDGDGDGEDGDGNG